MGPTTDFRGLSLQEFDSVHFGTAARSSSSALLCPFFREGSPSIDYSTKGTLILTSLLEDLCNLDCNQVVSRFSQLELPKTGSNRHAIVHIYQTANHVVSRHNLRGQTLRGQNICKMVAVLLVL